MRVRTSVAGRSRPPSVWRGRTSPARTGPAGGPLVLGHGAGGGVEAPDLVALTALTADGWLVARVEQPWRVAGRRIATPPAQLDTAWLAVLRRLTTGRARLPVPLVVGGRSAGARVACRTAAAVGATAVLALSFPLHPPGRPRQSRARRGAAGPRRRSPAGVVQGERDAFGGPQEVRAALGERGRRQAGAGARTRSPRTRPTWWTRCAAGWPRCGVPAEPGGLRPGRRGECRGATAVLNRVILKRRRRVRVFTAELAPVTGQPQLKLGSGSGRPPRH